MPVVLSLTNCKQPKVDKHEYCATLQLGILETSPVSTSKTHHVSAARIKHDEESWTRITNQPSGHMLPASPWAGECIALCHWKAWGLVHCGNKFQTHRERITFKHLSVLCSVLLGLHCSHEWARQKFWRVAIDALADQVNGQSRDGCFPVIGEILRKTNCKTYCRSLGTLPLQRKLRIATVPRSVAFSVPRIQ